MASIIIKAKVTYQPSIHPFDSLRNHKIKLIHVHTIQTGSIANKHESHRKMVNRGSNRNDIKRNNIKHIEK